MIPSATKASQNMHPTKGKGPLLLRFLNELLRRLPKSNTEHVIFSGRILMFLSSVFPLGEKSGVNLRGNFNITKGTVFEEKEDGMVVDEGRESSVPSAVRSVLILVRDSSSRRLLHDFLVPPALLHRPLPPLHSRLERPVQVTPARTDKNARGVRGGDD